MTGLRIGEILALRPWWRTPWFYIGCVFLTLELAFLLYRWHVRYLIEEKWRLEQKVRRKTRELQESNQTLETLAIRDGLTNLWNRSAIMEILARELGWCQREGSTVTVVLADLDHFKSINDTYGHLAGDSVLQEVAMRFKVGIRFYTRSDDTVAKNSCWSCQECPLRRRKHASQSCIMTSRPL